MMKNLNLLIQKIYFHNKNLATATILFFAGSQSLYSQVFNGNTEIDKIMPATPETYSLFKAGDFPVDYRTGKLNISIPIYTVNTKEGLSIPINLTYNTGGIKVDETSGTAGLGWSLAIPNSISVEQHGRNDLTNNSKWFPTEAYDYVYNEIKLEHLPVDLRTKLYGLEDGLLDMQPDIFHYNLPTISGSFIMDTNGNFHTIPYENIKISYSDTNKKFQITDPTGILYTLRVGNTLTSATGSSQNTSISSFFLESIKLLSGEEISFKYEKQMIYQSSSNSYQDIYAPRGGYDVICYSALTNVHSTTENWFIDILPTEIKYGNETVNFSYKNSIDGILGRKDIKSANPQNTFALDKVTVSNFSGNLVRNYKFNHTYFGSGNSPDYRKYRLKLTGISNLLENNSYAFQYNETYTPATESYAQDLWGYYNGKTDNVSLIPNMRYFNINYTDGGDRNVYPDYTQAFILNKVQYPTGGSSSFTYENNTVWDQLLIAERQPFEYGTLSNTFDNTQNEYMTVTKTTPPSEYFYIDADPVNFDELWVEFNNTCSNQTPDEIPVNGSSMGIAYLEEQVNNHWNVLSTFTGQNVSGELMEQKYFQNPTAPKRIRIVRTGNCSISLRIYKIKNVKRNGQNNPVGGLRIKAIEDFDGSVTYTKRQFDYHNPNTSGNRSSAYFASPLEFLKKTYKVIRYNDADILCDPYGLSADQAANSSLAGKDVVNYEYVTEHTLGKGRKVFKYSYSNNSLDLTIPDGSNGFNPYRLYNKNLLGETYYGLNSNTSLKETIYHYTPTYLKNSLSANYSSANQVQILPSTSMGIYKLSKINGVIFHSTRILSHYPIESGRFLPDEVLTKDYINGTVVETKANSNYTLDIQKPINLEKQTVTHSNNDNTTETSYLYAYEKSNQKLIDKNMIGIPLETSVKKSGNLVSKSETRYDNPAHLFPTSVKNYNVHDGSVNIVLTYDQYDAKGNILQYTTEKGIPVAIVWGYNSELPIAKVEGITYNQLVNAGLLSAIVSASNADASNPANEPALITALDQFRESASLVNARITTMTYDPGIGVTSSTSGNGIREIYSYDTAGRLKNVSDQEGKALKELQYNYKH